MYSAGHVTRQKYVLEFRESSKIQLVDATTKITDLDLAKDIYSERLRQQQDKLPARLDHSFSLLFNKILNTPKQLATMITSEPPVKTFCLLTTQQSSCTASYYFSTFAQNEFPSKICILKWSLVLAD